MVQAGQVDPSSLDPLIGVDKGQGFLKVSMFQCLLLLGLTVTFKVGMILVNSEGAGEEDKGERSKYEEVKFLLKIISILLLFHREFVQNSSSLAVLKSYCYWLLLQMWKRILRIYLKF